MTEPGTDPRAAQIEAVRDLLGSSTNRADGTDNDLDHLAAQLVDAVMSAGRDGQGEVAPDPGSPEHLRRMLAACRADLNRAVHERDALARRCAVRFEEAKKLRAELVAARAGWEAVAEDYNTACHERGQGEARGYARAVATLRDDDGFRAWQDAHPDAAYASQAVRKTLARYLEAVGPDGTPAHGVAVDEATLRQALAEVDEPTFRRESLGEWPSDAEPCGRTDLPEQSDMRCPCGFEAGEHLAWLRRYCRNRRFPEHGAVSPCVLCGYELHQERGSDG